MQQLPLDIKLADFALFETYYNGPNEAPVAALRHLASQSGQQVHWLWGRPGSGRSHLLQATVAAADGRCAWLPLGNPEELSPQILDGMGELELLCVDDIDAVAGDPVWERQLFRVFEELKSRQGRLVVSGSSVPTEAGFALPDLTSRLASGPVWRLRRLTDEDLLAALQLRAHWRGLDLSAEAAGYLVRRVTREFSVLFELLDKADQAALAAQRRLTVPFLKSVLETQQA